MAKIEFWSRNLPNYHLSILFVQTQKQDKLAIFLFMTKKIQVCCPIALCKHYKFGFSRLLGYCMTKNP